MLRSSTDGDGVGPGQFAQLGQRLVLGGRPRQLVQPRRQAVGGHGVEDAGRQSLGRQFLERGHPDHLEHGGDVGGVRTDVPVDEGRDSGGGGGCGHGDSSQAAGAPTTALLPLCRRPEPGA
jgi:hypothetical protein